MNEIILAAAVSAANRATDESSVARSIAAVIFRDTLEGDVDRKLKLTVDELLTALEVAYSAGIQRGRRPWDNIPR